MTENIEEGFMAFIADGQEGIGAVREVNETSIIIYVENAGEFVIPRSAVKDVHSEKVILRPELSRQTPAGCRSATRTTAKIPISWVNRAVADFPPLATAMKKGSGATRSLFIQSVW